MKLCGNGVVSSDTGSMGGYELTYRNGWRREVVIAVYEDCDACSQLVEAEPRSPSGQGLAILRGIPLSCYRSCGQAEGRQLHRRWAWQLDALTRSAHESNCKLLAGSLAGMHVIKPIRRQRTLGLASCRAGDVACKQWYDGQRNASHSILMHVSCAEVLARTEREARR